MLQHYTFDGFSVSCGGIGPMYFMLLTGLVMSKSYGKKVMDGSFSFKQFLLRRYFKFYPLHLMCLLAFVVLNRNVLTSDDFLPFVFNLLLLQSWVPVSDFYFSFNGVSWYLSTMLLFVFMFPLYQRCIGRMNEKTLGTVALFLLVIYCGYVSILQVDNLNYWLFVFPPIRQFDFIWGMMVWRWIQLHPSCCRFRYPTFAEILMVIGIVLSVITYPLHEKWHYALIHWLIMIPSLFIFVQDDSHVGLVSRFLKTRVMVFLGGLTLGTYLLHMPIFVVIFILSAKLGLYPPHIVMFAICVAVVIVISYYVDKFFVSPVNRKLISIFLK